MISNRVEKLKFLVDEMQIAFHLATHVGDAFVARRLDEDISVEGLLAGQGDFNRWTGLGRLSSR